MDKGPEFHYSLIKTWEMQMIMHLKKNALFATLITISQTILHRFLPAPGRHIGLFHN